MEIIWGQSRKLLYNQFTKDFAFVSDCCGWKVFICMRANIFWHSCTSSAKRMDDIFYFTCILGLLKKHQLRKLKAGRVVSHGFRHAKFNGARKNRFQALLGVVNLISKFLKMHGRSKNQNAKIVSNGCLTYVK